LGTGHAELPHDSQREVFSSRVEIV
jgi:hypothetical protein